MTELEKQMDPPDMDKQFPVGPIDLREGVIPITRAAASLSDLIKRVKELRQPVVITQNGYPAAVVLGIDAYTELFDLAKRCFEGEE